MGVHREVDGDGTRAPERNERVAEASRALGEASAKDGRPRAPPVTDDGGVGPASPVDDAKGGATAGSTEPDCECLVSHA